MIRCLFLVDFSMHQSAYMEVKLNIQKYIGSQAVTLDDMLLARENRAWKQQQLMQQHCHPVVSFSLNIAGSHKTFPMAERIFEEGMQQIEDQLSRYQMKALEKLETREKSGSECLYVVAEKPMVLKRRMAAIEDGFVLGRLFDIDVIRTNGENVSREEIGKENRLCLICNETAAVCARSRAHSVSELMNKTIEIMTQYLVGTFADQIAECACKSLLYEVTTTPKPGLIDRNNSGAHKDMDIYTFIDSTASLTPHFREFVLEGVRHADLTPESLFTAIRYPGMLAEESMFRATGGINTQKGLIFSLGVLCAALGWLYGRNLGIPAEEQEPRGTKEMFEGVSLRTHQILEICRQMTESSVLADFEGITAETARTFGEKLYATTGLMGIRGEVAKGFPSIRKTGLPTLRKCLAEGYNLNDSGAITLYYFIACVTDTNIISRGGLGRQRNIQKAIKEELQNNPFPSHHHIIQRDYEFIRENVSPGGCADLLALTFMLYFVEELPENVFR